MNRFAKLAILFFLSCGSSSIILHAGAGDVKHQLAEIDQQREGLGAQVDKLEQDCLNLLKECTTPEDTGMVYAEIGFIYAQNGLTQPDKTSLYNEMALSYPLGISTAAQAYVFWADALQIKHIESTGDEFMVARGGIATVCLNGLRSILEQNLPKSRQTLPVVHRFDYDGPEDDPQYQELLRKNKEELAQRERVMLQNTLILYRDALIEKCIYLYSREPKATDEFAQLAREILGDEEAVKELLSRIEP